MVAHLVFRHSLSGAPPQSMCAMCVQVMWLDEAALNATAFIKDGEKRACSFIHLQRVNA